MNHLLTEEEGLTIYANPDALISPLWFTSMKVSSILIGTTVAVN
jgi:predicted FMN-binding regulatory protein PaiB